MNTLPHKEVEPKSKSGKFTLCDGFFEGAQIRKTGSQVIPNNIVTAITFDFSQFDIREWNDVATNSITVPYDGLYWLHFYCGSFNFTAGSGAAGTSIQQDILINGTSRCTADYPIPTNQILCFETSLFLTLDAGDVVTASIFQNSGGSRTLGNAFGDSSDDTRLTVILVSRNEFVSYV